MHDAVSRPLAEKVVQHERIISSPTVKATVILFGTAAKLAAIARVAYNPYTSHVDSISVLRALFAGPSSLSIRRRDSRSVECLSNSFLDAVLNRRGSS